MIHLCLDFCKELLKYELNCFADLYHQFGPAPSKPNTLTYTQLSIPALGKIVIGTTAHHTLRDYKIHTMFDVK